MNWVLHAPGQSTSLIDKPLMRIGSDPSSDIYLPHPGLAAVHAILHSGNQLIWLEPVRPAGSHQWPEDSFGIDHQAWR